MNVFILTRFNIKLWWTSAKDGSPVQTEEWLEERFRLFEKYTYPSVTSLNYRDFHWICLFDASTPERFRQKVDGYIKDEPRLVACYITAQEAGKFQDVFRQKVRSLAKEGEGLITIYLDNDDCVRNDYIDKLIAFAKDANYGTVFSFKYGIQYYEQMNLAVRIPYPNNHFLAYYEEMGDHIKTIWGFWHFVIYKYRKINIYTDNNREDPMWIEVIHKANVDNDVKMTSSQKLVLQKDCLREFGLPIILKDRWMTVFLFCTSFQMRFLRQVARRIMDKIRRSN